jgi:hypothetical protein
MEPTWQVLFVDLLFLGLAGGAGLWFKAWLREQQEAIDQRLRVLEVQQKTLELLSTRLQSACLLLETLVSQQQGEEPAPRGKARPDSYARARELLSQGLPASEVARRLGLGVAEVDVLGRMPRRTEP